MSYYTLDKNSQIYGDYVKRLGDIVKEYNGEYPVTLYVSSLQSMLTILTESKLGKENVKNKLEDGVLGDMVTLENEHNIRILSSDINKGRFFSLDATCIAKNTYHGKLTFLEILKYMRHSLSHPVYGEKELPVPKTGFRAIEKDKKVDKIVFINSPDEMKTFTYLNDKNFQNNKSDDHFPPNAQLEFPNKRDKRIKYVYVDNKRFYRYIKIELSEKQLKELVLGVSALFYDFIRNKDNLANQVKALQEHYNRKAS